MRKQPTGYLVLHDYFDSMEGGGRLSSLLAQALDADLGYGFARHCHPFVETIKPPHRLDFQAYSAVPLWRQLKLARTFERRSTLLSHYQKIIFSGFYTPLGALHRPAGGNILYCHTPPRFVYDQRDFYLSRLPLPLRPLLKFFTRYLQPRYEAALQHMDVIVSNSQNVRKRLKKYTGQDSEVVHPPCEVERFRWLKTGNYYLSTARLDPLKRVDKIIEAFLQMPDKHLIVASGGSELKKLQQRAGNAANIEFTGWVSEAALARLNGCATATLYLPSEEDFGMSPLESMAAGKPVIGVNEGGLPETIIPGETGYLLAPDFTPADICAAVEELTPPRAQKMRKACEQRAYAFRSAVFVKRMKQLSGISIGR